MKKQLMRSGRDKKIAGVCAGVAHYFDIDPTIVRVIWGVLAFGYGAGIIAYIILWIILKFCLFFTKIGQHPKVLPNFHKFYTHSFS